MYYILGQRCQTLIYQSWNYIGILILYRRLFDSDTNISCSLNGKAKSMSQVVNCLFCQYLECDVVY